MGPHGIAKYEYDPDNPNPLKFPPYYDQSVVLGEFTQDTMRELKLDSQNRVFKINSFLPCGAANVPNSPFQFECDNPMDLQWGADGDFYLLTYGDGFFNINQDAGMYKWQYVKGTRTPKAVLAADRTDGPLPLTVQFTGDGSSDPDPGDSIRFEWDFGDGTAHSVDPNPTHTYTARGRYTVVLTVTDSSGKTDSQSTTITAGNTSPTVVVTTPVEGGTFDFGNDIPFTVTVTDPEDGTINCSDVQVTFVLGHDTHGHAEAGTTGCSGVLHTDAERRGSRRQRVRRRQRDATPTTASTTTTSRRSRPPRRSRSVRSTRRSSSSSASPGRTPRRTRTAPRPDRRASTAAASRPATGSSSTGRSTC